MTAAVAAAAGLTAAVAVIYLVVACQSLPAILGPVAGDTHPRTRLGAALLAVAVALAGGGWALGRRHRHR